LVRILAIGPRVARTALRVWKETNPKVHEITRAVLLAGSAGGGSLDIAQPFPPMLSTRSIR
jgi:hypothetical protein